MTLSILRVEMKETEAVNLMFLEIKGTQISTYGLIKFMKPKTKGEKNRRKGRRVSERKRERKALASYLVLFLRGKPTGAEENKQCNKKE